MYSINPPAVYAHESVMAHPTYRARVERVVAALQEPREIITYIDTDLPGMIADGLLANRVPMNTLETVGDPILLFNTFRFDGPEGEASRRKALADLGLPKVSHSLLGSGAFIWFDANLPTDPHRDDKVCRPCWRIHLQQGCLHRCAYCALGGLLVAMVNVEEYCQHLGELIRRHPWQTTYLLDDDGDPPGLEPELGVLGELIEYFGTLEDRYLIIHTKTSNTAWMRDLRHNGHTILVWSISGPTQSRLLEPGAGTTEQRIQAARTAQEAGYPIRHKFKPIIPMRGWREDAAYTTDLLFRETDPDNLSLCTFMWHTYPEMARRLPLELLEPAFVQAAEASQAEMADTRARPFPHWVREEIYRHHLAEIRKHSPDIPVCLSTENYRMWGAMRDALGCTAIDYVCGCGPQSVPGLRRLDCHPFRVAVRDDQGLVPGVAYTRS